MVFLSRNHDYAVVAVPSNSSSHVFDLLINVERRFNSAVGVPWHQPRERDDYFLRNAKPGDVRRQPTSCIMLWSNPLLRLLRGYAYQTRQRRPFVMNGPDDTLGLAAYVDKIAQTPDKARPDEARSQISYAEAWRDRITDVLVFENCETQLRRFVFRQFGVVLEKIDFTKPFSMLDVKSVAAALTPAVIALICEVYKADFDLLAAHAP